jgi:tetratricopeptide (TPR) repeat protein
MPTPLSTSVDFSSNGPDSGKQPSKTFTTWWSVGLLIALLGSIALAYWPGLEGGYVFDDYPNIVNNIGLRVTQLSWDDWLAAAFSSPSGVLQRPLAMLSFAVNYYFTGLDPRPMKLTNIVLHSLNALLVLGLVKSLLREALPNPAQSRIRQWVTGFATVAWALHPINLMAVLFIVQRMESLSHTFVFAGLWLYMIGRRHQQASSNGWVLIVLGLVACTVIGSLAKESATLLPLYALCLEICIFRFRGNCLRVGPWLWVLFGCLILLPMFVGGTWLLPKVLAPDAFSSRDFTLVERLLTEPRVILDYLRWIVLPNLGQLSLYHDDYVVSRSLLNPPSTLIGLIAIPALLIFCWLCRRRRPLVSLGVLWFLSAQLITATIIPLELVFEHRNYFASLGICLALADLLLVAPIAGQPRHTGALVSIAFIFFCAITTHLRAREWSAPVRFAHTEAAKHPYSPRATYGEAWVLVMASRYKADSPITQAAFLALERARQVPRSGILPDQAALVLAAHTNMPLKAAWWNDTQTKLRQRPIGPQELNALGALTTCTIENKCLFPPEAMLDTFAAALTKGANPEVLNIYGNYALNVLGDTDLALRLWQEACALRPTEREYHISLSKLLIELERYDEAREHITRLRQLGRFGQYRAIADSLEARLESSKKMHAQSAD